MKARRCAIPSGWVELTVLTAPGGQHKQASSGLWRAMPIVSAPELSLRLPYP
jgi:hypothetical protein